MKLIMHGRIMYDSRIKFRPSKELLPINQCEIRIKLILVRMSPLVLRSCVNLWHSQPISESPKNKTTPTKLRALALSVILALYFSFSVFQGNVLVE